uniref:HIT domain-containing protein n=1 Tax=Trichuris muris TaxID=70415 RepID=A0A5S6QFU1_TRIMR
MMSEEAKAQTAKPSSDSIFSKIIRREIPASIIYEDDTLIAFHDAFPQAPVHFLVVPKKPLDKLDNATAEDTELLGKLILTAKDCAKKLQLLDGYRLVINNGRHGCQSIFHIHVHVLGGRQLAWPPG